MIEKRITLLFFILILLSCRDSEKTSQQNTLQPPEQISGIYKIIPAGNILSVEIRKSGELTVFKTENRVEKGFVNRNKSLIQFYLANELIGVFSLNAFTKDKHGWKGIWSQHTRRLVYVKNI